MQTRKKKIKTLMPYIGDKAHYACDEQLHTGVFLPRHPATEWSDHCFEWGYMSGFKYAIEQIKSFQAYDKDITLSEALNLLQTQVYKPLK